MSEYEDFAPRRASTTETTPLASQVVGRLGPVSTVDSAEPMLEDITLPTTVLRFRALRQLLRRGKFRAGLILFGTVALLAVLAPLVGRYDPNALDFTALNANPSSEHWLGTDYL